MVIEMTKYSFILLAEETENFLAELAQLGIVDITRSKRPVDAHSTALLEQAHAMKKALATLAKVEQASTEAVSFQGFAHEAVLGTSAKLAELVSASGAAAKTVKAAEPWGCYDRAAVAELSALGLNVHYYCVSKKAYSPTWENDYAIQIISEDASNVYFVALGSEEIALPISECAAPSVSLNEAQQALESIEAQIAQTKEELAALKNCTAEIEKDYADTLAALDLYLAGAAKEAAAENRLDVLVGYAPASDEATLCEKFDSLGVFYEKEVACVDDNPPIKLKNNKFASMFEVLTEMYGSPNYNEFDPTPILGPFFLLFFSLCMGDAGYGILLMIIGPLLKKLHIMESFSGLVTALGIGTFVIGLFLGTAFGVNLYEAAWVPECCKACIIHGQIAGYDAAMVLALIIGVFHICLAMIIKTVVYTKQSGFLNNLATWGWTLLIVGGVILAAVVLTGLLVISPLVMKIIIIVLGVVSALGIYVFNDLKRNPLMNIGSGLWDTYNMATGLLGDVLSYIRLYALGLAGGMLGSAFNDLGVMVLDGAGPIVGIIACALIMIVGHALNLAMSCLGAFVHPLRLTFVEFFKNSGYEGRGKKYTPLGGSSLE